MTRPELRIMACVFCKDPLFRQWIRDVLRQISPKRDTSMITDDEAGAKKFILMACEIKSRNELDTDGDAAKRFHGFIREPFLAWKEEL